MKILLALGLLIWPLIPLCHDAAPGCTANPALDDQEVTLVLLVNAYRSAHGLQELTVNEDLSRAAQWKTDDLAVNLYFSHHDPGRLWHERLRDCGYYGGWAGEVLYISEYPEGVYASEALRQWQLSPAHNEALLSPEYREIGVGRTYRPDLNRWYWAVEMGSY